MILDFGDSATEDLFHGRTSSRVRRFPSDVKRIARRKLDMLNAARGLRDLRSPPGNRLETLRGEWSGFHSIRVNDQWRVVFRWRGSDAESVRVIDYHKG